MNAAHKGRRFEHEVREIFHNAGFNVIRGAGSRGKFIDGTDVDLVCTKLTNANEYKVFLSLIGVQCKVRAR
jgi:Holliday junction resolvase